MQNIIHLNSDSVISTRKETEKTIMLFNECLPMLAGINSQQHSILRSDIKELIQELTIKLN